MGFQKEAYVLLLCLSDLSRYCVFLHLHWLGGLQGEKQVLVLLRICFKPLFYYSYEYIQSGRD
jgi:hypothetical protein